MSRTKLSPAAKRLHAAMRDGRRVYYSVAVWGEKPGEYHYSRLNGRSQRRVVCNELAIELIDAGIAETGRLNQLGDGELTLVQSEAEVDVMVAELERQAEGMQ